MELAPLLRGERVTLRPPRETDKAERLALGRDPEIVRMFGGDWRNLAPLTVEEVERGGGAMVRGAAGASAGGLGDRT
jgi:hypothetical protein